jgi:hypothetical protein
MSTLYSIPPANITQANIIATKRPGPAIGFDGPAGVLLIVDPDKVRSRVNLLQLFGQLKAAAIADMGTA